MNTSNFSLDEAKRQHSALRENLLQEVRSRLPKEQKYVDYHVPHCAGIKYLYPDGSFGLYRAYEGQQQPHGISDLSVEGLISLLEQLPASA